MSYRCCSECDKVVDNTCYKSEKCPDCGSSRWSCSVEDVRDWGELYREQKKNLKSDNQ